MEGWAAGKSSEMCLTQALTSCVLSGQPWNLPPPSIILASSLPGGGRETGGPGLTVPMPERVQLAVLQACLMLARGLQRRCLQPPNPICLDQSLQLIYSKLRAGCVLCQGARSHTREGHAGVNRWAVLYKPCLTSSEYWLLCEALPPSLFLISPPNPPACFPSMTSGPDFLYWLTLQL